MCQHNNVTICIRLGYFATHLVWFEIWIACFNEFSFLFLLLIWFCLLSGHGVCFRCPRFCDLVHEMTPLSSVNTSEMLVLGPCCGVWWDDVPTRMIHQDGFDFQLLLWNQAHLRVPSSVPRPLLSLKQAERCYFVTVGGGVEVKIARIFMTDGGQQCRVSIEFPITCQLGNWLHQARIWVTVCFNLRG